MQKEPSSSKPTMYKCNICGLEKNTVTPGDYFDKHHPDKKKYPTKTIRICKDCHYKIHNSEKENDNILVDGYGILPNKILFDNDLSSTAKLLYVLISSLCAERGYCFANNKYLSEKMDIAIESISRHITSLDNYLYFKDRTSYQRRIYLSSPVHNTRDNSRITKQKDQATMTKTSRYHDKNVKHNTINKDYKYNNSFKNNKYGDNSEVPFDVEASRADVARMNSKRKEEKKELSKVN